VTPDAISVACIALLGLANSLMWPSIFPLAIDGLGKFTQDWLGAPGNGNRWRSDYAFDLRATSAAIGSQRAYAIMIPCFLFLFCITRPVDTVQEKNNSPKF